MLHQSEKQEDISVMCDPFTLEIAFTSKLIKNHNKRVETHFYATNGTAW